MNRTISRERPLDSKQQHERLRGGIPIIGRNRARDKWLLCSICTFDLDLVQVVARLNNSHSFCTIFFAGSTTVGGAPVTVTWKQTVPRESAG